MTTMYHHVSNVKIPLNNIRLINPKDKKEITIEVTQKCENKCNYCSSISCNKCTTMIPLDKIKDIIDQAKELKFTHVNLSGGEPFLYPNINDIVDYIKSKDLYVTLYSSGVYNDNGKITSIPEQLISKCNVDTIIFNMQTTSPDIYKQIVQENHEIDILLESIKTAIHNINNTEINYVPMKINCKCFDNVIKKCKELSVKNINILKLVVQGRGTRSLVPSDDEYNEILIKAKNECGINIRIGDSNNKCICGTNNCKAGKYKLVVRYDGIVLPCERYKFLKGNSNSIYKKSLKDIYQYYLNGGLKNETSKK